MTTSPVHPAALQALAAYGSPAPKPSPKPAADAVFVPAGRHVVRAAPGITVELSADARAALIAVQSGSNASAERSATPTAARAPALSPEAPASSVLGADPPARPGSRLNLTV